MKANYPVEAFALAIILFSPNAAQAVVVGITIVLGAAIACTVREKDTTSNKLLAAFCSFAVVAAVIYGAFVWLGWQINLYICFEIGSIAALCALFAAVLPKETDLNDVVYSSAIAYAVSVVMSLVCEGMAFAKLFGTAIYTLDIFNGLVSASYAKIMSTMMFSGLGIALTNLITKQSSEKNLSLCVILPAFIFNAVGHPDLLQSFTAAAISMVLLYGALQRLKYSNAGKYVSGFALNEVVASFIMMIALLV